jgi:hypothetical protein
LAAASLTVSLLEIVMVNIASLHRSAQTSLLKGPSATTHQYTHANLRMKERALAKLQEPDAKLRRYRAPDSLIEVLKKL